jgi:hypothetical protein
MGKTSNPNSCLWYHSTLLPVQQVADMFQFLFLAVCLVLSRMLLGKAAPVEPATNGVVSALQLIYPAVYTLKCNAWVWLQCASAI